MSTAEALDVDPVDVFGRWYRHVADSPDGAPRDPLWLSPDRAGASRWQRNGVVRAIYLADSIETMWAEWFRHLAENALEQSEALPRQLFAYDMELAGVANLSTAARLRRVGLAPIPPPSRRSWPAYQAVGHRLRDEGYPGLLARAAARPSHTILCVFRPDSVLAGCVGQPTYLGRHETPPPVPTGMRT